MGSRNTKSVTRPVATANSLLGSLLGYDDDYFASERTPSRTLATTLRSTDEGILNAAKVRAAQLLKENPELVNSDSVMLPTGQVIRRPAIEITRGEALRRVQNDVRIGRVPDIFEKNFANGDIVTRSEQELAQQELMNKIATGMRDKNSFDAIVLPDQKTLRIAAGISPQVAEYANDVKVKAKTWQNNSGSGSGSGSSSSWIGSKAYGAMINKIPGGSPLREEIKNALRTAGIKDDGAAKNKLREIKRSKSGDEERIIQEAIDAIG